MQLLPPRVPAVLGPRGDFEPEEFRRKLATHGADLIWEAAYECPCGRKMADVASELMSDFSLDATQTTGDHQSACTMCKGSGYILTDAQPVKGFVQSVRVSNGRAAPAGEYDSGRVQITLFPETKPSMGDRFTRVNSVIVVREMRQRSTDVVEAMRFPVAGQVQDLATGKRNVRTLRVQKANASNITTSADVLVEGTDFDVNGQGKIDWTKGIANGHAPVTGAHYTASYYANPRYVVTDDGHGTRDAWDGAGHPENSPEFAALPITVYARREYLGARGSRA